MKSRLNLRNALVAKTLILFSAITFTHNVQAQKSTELAPHVVVGSYNYQGFYKIEYVRLEDFMDTATESGAERLKQRIVEGFTCRVISGTQNSCFKMESPDQADPDIKRNVDYDYKNYQLVFGPQEGLPNLTYDGPDYKVWEVHQVTSCDSVNFDKVVYINSQGVEKIALGPNEYGTSFYYNYDAGVISIPRTMNLRRGELMLKTFVSVRLDPAVPKR